jgi:hypothetical protein
LSVQQLPSTCLGSLPDSLTSHHPSVQPHLSPTRARIRWTGGKSGRNTPTTVPLPGGSISFSHLHPRRPSPPQHDFASGSRQVASRIRPVLIRLLFYAEVHQAGRVTKAEHARRRIDVTLGGRPWRDSWMLSRGRWE